MTFSEYRKRFSSGEDFMREFGRLSREEAMEMIGAELCPNALKACMMSTWNQARREVKLCGVRVETGDAGALAITFYENDSDFDGNDFRYTYCLDAGNAAGFLKRIPRVYADAKTNVEEWLIANVDCEGIGGDLLRAWVRMGLRGTRRVREDYPGGIDREEAF